jgi:uncharacterized membrane protein
MIKLHPAIVHFPIALLLVAALFAVISLFEKDGFFKKVAFWNLLLGVIGAMIAVVTGLVEEQTLVHDEEVHQILVKHKFNGLAVMIFSQILLIWYWVRKNKLGRVEYILWTSLLAIGTAMVIYQGFLGGKMVFDKGAGVKPVELQLKKEGRVQGKHNHSDAAAEHDHNNDKIAPSSKKIQPTSDHDHNKGHDTASLRNEVPESKKELKDMKY